MVGQPKIIAFYCPSDHAAALIELLEAALPDFEIRVWPDDDVSMARYAVVWSPPGALFGQATRLRALFNLGAGVNVLLENPAIPVDLPIVRLADAGMADQMSEYALYVALRLLRDMDLYASDQAMTRWDVRMARDRSAFRIGILGLGVLGGHIGGDLEQFGFAVAGWARSPKRLPGIVSLEGEVGLEQILSGSDLLINLLPLTSDTRGILNRDRLRRLPPDSAILNLARGGHVVEEDLIEVLDTGHLRGAYLDVTADEPLPPGHPFWAHPRVFLTPHTAGQTLPVPTIEQVSANIRRMEAGKPPRNVVDRGKGY